MIFSSTSWEVLLPLHIVEALHISHLGSTIRHEYPFQRVDPHP